MLQFYAEDSNLPDKTPIFSLINLGNPNEFPNSILGISQYIQEYP
jgi:hypothetical protein